LEEKCRQRDRKRGGYQSVNEIVEDIVDLAGVRVALYFPAERDQVDGMINRLFTVVDPKKTFPDPSVEREGKRFSGYSAVHYRIRLREQDLSESDKRYAAARIEIQVASVLMHAWAEVEHDLVYKPVAGELSDEEHSLLDQLNGLVLAGEISLEKLQKAGEARVAVSGRKIANHYDLAVHLLSRAAEITDKPISESGLGRVDLLFDLITKLGKDMPERLAPYLEALHGNVEARPLAEQIIDALLAEDASRYELYNTIRTQRHAASYGTESDGEDVYRQVGIFINQWIKLEQLLLELLRPPRPVVPTARQLVNMGLLDSDTAAEYDRLRRLRNYLVHGIEIPAPADLAEATRRIEAIVSEINRRWGERNDGKPD
jgi:ppGpp synthetase/RelA/SpoT-type nucleotidyltranferase